MSHELVQVAALKNTSIVTSQTVTFLLVFYNQCWFGVGQFLEYFTLLFLFSSSFFFFFWWGEGVWSPANHYWGQWSLLRLVIITEVSKFIASYFFMQQFYCGPVCMRVYLLVVPAVVVILFTAFVCLGFVVCFCVYVVVVFCCCFFCCCCCVVVVVVFGGAACFICLLSPSKKENSMHTYFIEYS